jgi:hypothetical protein
VDARATISPGDDAMLSRCPVAGTAAQTKRVAGFSRDEGVAATRGGNWIAPAWTTFDREASFFSPAKNNNFSKLLLDKQPGLMVQICPSQWPKQNASAF